MSQNNKNVNSPLNNSIVDVVFMRGCVKTYLKTLPQDSAEARRLRNLLDATKIVSNSNYAEIVINTTESQRKIRDAMTTEFVITYGFKPTTNQLQNYIYYWLNKGNKIYARKPEFVDLNSKPRSVCDTERDRRNGLDPLRDES